MPYDFLSDIHGDAAALEAVLAALGWAVILGNADDFLLDVPADSAEEITDAQLEPRHLEQIRAFHRTYEHVRLPAFHGSPRSYDDVLLPRRSGDALHVNPGAVPEYAVVTNTSVEFRRCVS